MKINSQRSCCGSALIVSILVTTVLSILAATYLKLSLNTLRLSDRVHYRNASYNLAESGVEHAAWTLAEAVTDNTIWDGDWTISGNVASRTLNDFQYGGKTVGTVKIAIIDYDSGSPTVVSKGSIAAANGMEVERYLSASFGSVPTSSGIFAFGMLAKGTIDAVGGASIDSWRSDADSDPTTAAVPYSSAVALDNALVGSASTDVPAVSIGSSDIYGKVAVGSMVAEGLKVGWGGQVGPRDPGEWDPADTTDLWKVNGRKVSNSTGALQTGLTVEFLEVSAPSGGTYQSPFELPRNESVSKSNASATWTENQYVSGDTIGSSGVETFYEMQSLRIAAAAELVIAGDVILHLTSLFDALSVVESGKITLEQDATLTIYTPGSVTISGEGIANSGPPQNFQIWGTGDTESTFNLQGSGSISGVVYAPNANIVIPGGTKFYGAVVGNNITMAGSGSFHYDESLQNAGNLGYTGGGSGSTLPKLSYLGELVTSADRKQYAAYLN